MPPERTLGFISLIPVNAHGGGGGNLAAAGIQAADLARRGN